MQALAALILICAGGAVEVSLAPDQPLPFVYVDDPLIVELRATEDAEAEVYIEVAAVDGSEKTETHIPAVPLRAKGSRWIAVADLPLQRGYYRAKIRVVLGARVFTEEIAFCRVDRPAHLLDPAISATHALPLRAWNNAKDPRLLLIMKHLGVHIVQLEATQNLEDLPAAARHMNLAVDIQETAQVAALLNDHTEPAAWTIPAREDPNEVKAIATSVRKAGSAAPIALRADNLDAWNAALEAGTAQLIRGLVLPDINFVETAPKAHAAGEEWGYEAWTLLADASNLRCTKDADAVALLQHLFSGLAAGADGMIFDAKWIYNGAAGPWMAYLSGLSHRMKSGRYAGSIPAGAGVSAPLFRDGAAWFIPLWSNGAGRTAETNLANAENLVLTDALNNPLTIPPAGKIPVTESPRYLTGTGGAPLEEAAYAQAAELAKNITENPKFQRYLPEGLMRAAAHIGNAPERRSRFFQLLRYLPALERQWHAGELPRTVAVPAIAALARLARPLCTLEQASGTPFLEPLHETLLKCEEYQSAYLLTSSGAAPQAYERGDWLLREVQRLAAEAEALEQAGRKIEACAVAALAEWRALALSDAAKAGPMSDAAQELPMEVAPPVQETPPAQPEPENTDTGEESPTTPTESPETDDSEPAPKEEIPEKVQEPAPAPKPVLKPGQPPNTRELTHTVKSVENPSVISKKYNVTTEDLLTWNKLTKRSVLHIGDKLVVYISEQ